MMMAYVLIARPRSLSPVVALGVLTGVLGAGFFLAAFFAADNDLPPVLQLLVKLLRDLPVVLIVLYACGMQLREYSYFTEPLPASRRWVKRWYTRSVPVVVSSFALGGLAELIIRPAFLESDAPLPPLVVVSDGLILLPLAFYAALACFVFGRTLLGNAATRFRDGMENFCGVVALGGLSLLALHTLAWRAVRAFLPVEQVDPILEQMSTNQVFAVGAVALSISVGLISHSTRDTSTREASRRFVSLASDLGYFSGRLANSPVRAPCVRECYDAMLEATGPEFLDMDPAARRRAQRIFHGTLLLNGEPEAGDKEVRRLRERLRGIVRLCEKEHRSSLLTNALASGYPHSLPDTLLDVLIREEETGQTSDADARDVRRLGRDAQVILHPESVAEHRPADSLDHGTRLALVALWDAGALPTESGALDEAWIMRGEAADAYNLAKYRIRICGRKAV